MGIVVTLILIGCISTIATLKISIILSGINQSKTYSFSKYIILFFLLNLLVSFILGFLQQDFGLNGGLVQLFFSYNIILFITSLFFFKDTGYGLRIKQLLYFILAEITFIILFALLIVLIRTFAGFLVTHVGKSMEPNFSQGSLSRINKLNTEIKRGDVVYFNFETNIPATKRVIGLPGEIVGFRKGKVYICPNDNECNVLDEPYLSGDIITLPESEEFNTFELTDGYFVIGDNREHSIDSRSCLGLTCLDSNEFQLYHEDIVGKAFNVLSQDEMREIKELIGITENN